MAKKQNSLKPQTSAVVKLSRADHAFSIGVDIIMAFFLVVIAIPLWSTIMLSLRPSTFIGSYLQGMVLPPWKWSFAAYRSLLGNNGFLLAFWNSVRILVGGVACALVLNIPLAYGLSVRGLPGKKWLTILIVIPYVFNVGMVPTYIMVAKFGLTNHLASVYLPVAINTYNLLIMRSFFEGIPNELRESASIDGCNEVQTLIRIILPLSKAIILTIGLFYGVNFWNNYFNPILYLSKDYLRPLPILLRNILIGASMNEFVEARAFSDAPVEAIKAASVFMSAIPMVIAYPFIQKYFTKGTLLGSVKG